MFVHLKNLENLKIQRHPSNFSMGFKTLEENAIFKISRTGHKFLEFEMNTDTGLIHICIL